MTVGITGFLGVAMVAGGLGFGATAASAMPAFDGRALDAPSAAAQTQDVYYRCGFYGCYYNRRHYYYHYGYYRPYRYYHPYYYGPHVGIGIGGVGVGVY